MISEDSLTELSSPDNARYQRVVSLREVFEKELTSTSNFGT
jgi:hypothetical protein